MPKSNRIRIIDFGGATRYDDYHSATICTRQYRPPEVILECCQWTEIADVWSVGCIIAELFTGELLFPAHSDQEHLLMIGKNSGAFPNWMIAKTPSSLRKLFKDGVLSEEEAERHIEDWSGIRNMPITADIFKDCSALRDLVGQCL